MAFAGFEGWGGLECGGGGCWRLLLLLLLLLVWMRGGLDEGGAPVSRGVATECWVEFRKLDFAGGGGWVVLAQDAL